MEGAAASQQDVVEKVRESASFVADRAKDVRINTEALRRFVDNLEKGDFEKNTEVISLPLNFPTLEDEVNFWALLDILNFGSGFRAALHKKCQQGAFDTMMRGVMGMYISGEQLNSEFLRDVSLAEVGSLFMLELTEDEELKEGIFYISKPSALHPLAMRIREALNETGRILLAQGCKGGLGAWVVDYVRKQVEKHGQSSAADLVDALVNTFPPFFDTAQYEGRQVFVIKKAQLLAADLYRKLKDREPLFNFADIHRLTVFSDNVLPAVLRKFGILEASDNLAAAIESQQEIPAGSAQEVELRLMAVKACEDAIRYYNSKAPEDRGGIHMDTVLLDYYLWRKGKEGDFRKYPRHVARDTSYY